MDPYPGRYAQQLLDPRHDTAWQLIKKYWQSKHRFPAYLFLTIVLAMTISLVALNVVFTYWYNYIYEVLQSYDKHGIMRIAIVLLTIAAFYLLWALYQHYVARLIHLHGRRWLTQQFIGRLLERRGIQKDVDALVNFSIDFSMGLIGTITTFLAFTYILWQLSDEMTLSIGSLGTVQLPGYLVWIGFLYGLMGIVFTFKFKRPLVPLRFEQQSQQHLGNFLQRFCGNIHAKFLLWGRAGCYQMTIVLPIMVALPNFIDNVILISWLIQSVQAFNRVQGSLSSIVRSYPVASIANTADT